MSTLTISQDTYPSPDGVDRAKLRALRAERGLSGVGVARLLGWKQSRYSLTERGFRKFTPSAVRDLAAILDVPIADLIIQA